MTLTKYNIRGTVRVKTYPVMAAAIEIGVSRGWRRAHKHVDKPEEYDILAAIENAIMEEIDERFEFDSDSTDSTSTCTCSAPYCRRLRTEKPA